MTSIHWVMSRLQFRRDMCQALYLPKGKKGRDFIMLCVPSRRVTDAYRWARAASLDASIKGRVAQTYV
jgi:hypothetical protein